jgi:NMD protein affecting ribosome stability and mRNA decay
MTAKQKSGDYLREQRHDRLIQELDHDPYHSKLKLKQPSLCTVCGAVYQDGRWQWLPAPEPSHETVCPACQRIKDRVPAAFLTIRGNFLPQHRSEIMHLIENYAERERAEHPLKRLMDRKETDEGFELTFTDAHLARGIGEALHKAYQGELDYEYTKGDIMLRVTWERG